MQSWIRDLIDLKTQISVLQNCMQQPASSHAAPASHYRVADNVNRGRGPLVLSIQALPGHATGRRYSSGCLRSTDARSAGQAAARSIGPAAPECTHFCTNVPLDFIVYCLPVRRRRRAARARPRAAAPPPPTANLYACILVSVNRNRSPGQRPRFRIQALPGQTVFARRSLDIPRGAIRKPFGQAVPGSESDAAAVQGVNFQLKKRGGRRRRRRRRRRRAAALI
eukprot:SAG25_NODE_255_length_10943_cov_46.952047_10_plen_224_part_00